MIKYQYDIVTWPDGSYGVRETHKIWGITFARCYLCNDLNKWCDSYAIRRFCKMGWEEAKMIRERAITSNPGLSDEEFVGGAKEVDGSTYG